MKASEIASIIKAGGKVKVNRGQVEAIGLPKDFTPVKVDSLVEKLEVVKEEVKAIEAKAVEVKK